MSTEVKNSVESVVANYRSLDDFNIHLKDEVYDYFKSTIGENEIRNICKFSCQAPPYTSIRIDLKNITREEALEQVKTILEPYNALLKQEGRAEIVPYLHESIRELIIIPSAKSVCPPLNVLKSYPLVIIDRMCAESVLRGSDIFVKGVRSVDKNCMKGQKVCLAVDLCNTDLPRGSDISLFNGNNVIIGDAIIEMTRTEVFSLDSGLCLDHIHRLSFDLPPLQELPSFLLMQNFPSLITAKVLNPQPHECVLDCCAAPGNKWSHLAMLMQDTGMDRSRKKAIDNLFSIKKKFGYKCLQIRYVDMTKGVMNESEEKRLIEEAENYKLDKVDNTVNSIGMSKNFQKKMQRIINQKGKKNTSIEEQAKKTLERVKTLKKTTQKIEKNNQEQQLLVSLPNETIPDSLKHLLQAGIEAKTAKIPGYPHEVFDCVLLDPPCSALGLRPRLSHLVTMEDLYGYRSYQRQFIDVAIQLLRVGGVMVYSTCTYDPLENEENVAFILKNYPMELVQQDESLRFGKEGLANCGLSDEERRKVQRFNMTEDCNSIGFFISKFRKTGEYHGKKYTVF